MKLIIATPSPFARKVRISLLKKKLNMKKLLIYRGMKIPLL